MQSLFRSCGRWIALYFVLAGLAAALVYARFPVVRVALGTGAVAGVFLWLGIGYLFGLGSRSTEARMIRRAKSGGRPADGEKIAVTGVVSGGMEALESPIARRRCMAYEYKVLQGEENVAATYEGFALAPLSIDGPRGSIRLLAVPELAFPEERFTSPQHVRNFSEYAARTEWTVHEGLDIKREFGFLKTVIADDDGRIRYDIRRGAPPDDLSSMKIVEKTLAPGEKVTAIGRFSSARGGLAPDPTAMLHAVKIQKGDADEVLRGMRSGAVDVGLGCGCLLPVIVAAIVALALVPLDAIEQMIPTKEPTWTEVRVERFIDRNVRKRVPALAESGETVIQLGAGEARGRLNDIRLRNASATRDGDAIDVTITDDASHGVVLRVRGKALESARVIGGGAISGVDVEQLHVDEQEIVGRVTYLSKELNLRVAFRASTAPSTP